jgi:hypothetical protein
MPAISEGRTRELTVFTLVPEAIPDAFDGPSREFSAFAFYPQAYDPVDGITREFVVCIDGISDIEGDPSLPSQFSVVGPVPNPARPRARFKLGLPQPAAVSLDVFDCAGRRLPGAASTWSLPAGWHTLDLRPGDWRSGVYFYRLRLQEKEWKGKLLIIN